MNRSDLTGFIKSRAYELGFESCGISAADFLESEAHRFEQWLNQGRHGTMAYMADHFDKRLDPRKLVPGAKSVISLSYNYYTEEKQVDPDAPKVSIYAFGRDYHRVVKKKLLRLFADIREKAGAVEGRCFVDSAPVLERAWAAKSGLGWVGKNTMLLTKAKGSYYFLAELILDVELDCDGPVKDYCGSCTRCIDACPTDAIFEPYKVDGSRCISYFTIELKEDKIPEAMKGSFRNWAFGCDICQQVCPINARAVPHDEPGFQPKKAFLGMSKNDWQDLTEDAFDELFNGTPLRRAKFKGLKRNLRFLAEKESDTNT